ncbi:pilus biosynthesis protein TadE [Nocardia puris]|uniref:Pilus assembly protein TadE n=1 Tax=Nocardia puris TaxID=208602 RepID=A0A366DB92_9NOCA|nr:TadE family type IV pilus minor pilin [Nocardia puris]MBF6216045.1 pilus biosynthesis protein TadE [Nocardia puris]MBF6366057.1 pilus biosynthesis protein TadE [Nocardia puris]MBF6460300.1 pilus biosynthesis protein TadE [Nocardia puris]RBO87310.1 hypothetical protein DFR74_11114 [Nocardia puris]
MEAAISLGALVAAVLTCLGVLLAASAQVRCVDAAREAARLTARGDESRAVPTAHRVAPSGADITVRVDGSYAIATVTARPPLLPLRLHAEAVAALEPEIDR